MRVPINYISNVNVDAMLHYHVVRLDIPADLCEVVVYDVIQRVHQQKHGL